MPLSYFVDQYSQFRLPHAADGNGGFRGAQLGALHAIAAHFSLHTTAAIVTMPTGSGKTAVLMGSAFLLRARRVLVLTPSRLVREQVARNFRQLQLLRELGAVPASVPQPRVHVPRHRPRSEADWREFESFDVVVGTPARLSPALTDVADPPSELFDLVLVDEAHHAPAKTWSSILVHFAAARQVLFTATPFRRDQKEIRGKVIYNYEVAGAIRDRVFGDLRYVPVLSDVNGNGATQNDEAIARAAEKVLRQDQENGFDHRLLVRTDARHRADELLGLYAAATQLRLATVTSRHSLRAVTKILAALKAGELDGIVCVSMLGEGFDFPQLKIAAIHSPHRSLAVTLQFLGRFARTGERLGPATILAIPEEIEGEATKLFEANAVWPTVVANLSAARVHEEVRTREILEAFAPTVAEPGENGELSLHSLKPLQHVKIYDAPAPNDLNTAPRFARSEEVLLHRIAPTDAGVASVTVTRVVARPRWAATAHFDSIEHTLVVLYHHAAAGLLFVASSQRAEGFYRRVVGQYGGAQAQEVSFDRVNRVLLDLDDPSFYHVGVRATGPNAARVSYESYAGRAADAAVEQGDGRTKRRGHLIGRGTQDGREVHVGLSSRACVWSVKASRLPQFLDWCNEIARKLQSNRVPVTGRNIDYLATGTAVRELPGNLVAVDWSPDVYAAPPSIRYNDANGVQHEALLLDLDIEIDHERTNAMTVGLTVSSDVACWPLSWSLPGSPVAVDNAGPEVEDGDKWCSLAAMLRHYPPVLHTSDFGRLEGTTHFPPLHIEAFDPERCTVVDWAKAGVDICCEVGLAKGGMQSIHAYLGQWLTASPAAVVFYDHGKGEIADFVAFTDDPDRGVLIDFYHCKKSGEDRPGARVEDGYDVCGQVIKSTNIAYPPRLLERMARRLRRPSGDSEFLRGDLNLATVLLDRRHGFPQFRVRIVQPGISKGALSEDLAAILAAADRYLRDHHCGRLQLLVSA